MSDAERKVRILSNLYGRISIYADRMPDGRLYCCGWPHPGNPLLIQRPDDAIQAWSVVEVVDHLWQVACERFTRNQIRAAMGIPKAPADAAECARDALIERARREIPALRKQVEDNRAALRRIADGSEGN